MESDVITYIKRLILGGESSIELLNQARMIDSAYVTRRGRACGCVISVAMLRARRTQPSAPATWAVFVSSMLNHRHLLAEILGYVPPPSSLPPSLPPSLQDNFSVCIRGQYAVYRPGNSLGLRRLWREGSRSWKACCAQHAPQVCCPPGGAAGAAPPAPPSLAHSEEWMGLVTGRNLVLIEKSGTILIMISGNQRFCGIARRAIEN